MKRVILSLIAVVMMVNGSVFAQNSLSPELAYKVKNEGFAKSKIEEMAQLMTDNMGPRLAASQLKLRAEQMVIEYLKRLTFLSKEEIEAIAEEHNAAPEKRLAQKKLAEEILRDLHGDGAYESAVKISELLFAGQIKEIPLNDLLAGLKDVPHFETNGGNVMDVLVSAGVCSSKREAREFISNGSITLNGEPLKAMDLEINAENALGGKYVVIRRGKKKYYLGELI